MDILNKLNTQLNLNLTNNDLFLTAFTHRSYLNEHLDYKLSSNERLEFLGDAVLQFLSSKHLYTTYSTMPEGDLTNLRASIVKTQSLAAESKNLNFGSFLLMSKGEEVTGGRDREYLLANCFESFLGALYLEKGIEECEKFLSKHLFYKLEEIISEDKYKDSKTKFQEKIQELKKTTPTYKVIETAGLEHEKVFKVAVFVGEDEFAIGEGASKQKAEQDAAKKGLDKLN